MSDFPRLSVIVRNRNQGTFLRDTIDSVLSQSYSNFEVIVVDDASDENSGQIINALEKKIVALFRDEDNPINAWNAGFRKSNGEAVLFANSGDILLPDCLAKVARLISNTKVIGVQWQQWGIDDKGTKVGRILPNWPPTEGDFGNLVIRNGPHCFDSYATTGNAWSWPFVNSVLASEFAVSDDIMTSLFTLAPVMGTVRTLFEPQGCYRSSSNNDFEFMPVHRKYKKLLAYYDLRCRILQQYLQSKNIVVNPDTWKKMNSWISYRQQVYDATERIASHIRPRCSFILIDDNCWEKPVFADRRAIPLLERDGMYMGKPEDDAMALSEVKRLSKDGATHIVFTSETLWWLEYYKSLSSYLHMQCPIVLKDEYLAIFEIRQAENAS